MTGKTSAALRGTTDDAVGATRRRGLRRLFARAVDPDRSSWRAGTDPFPATPVTPRVWAALG